jgi:SAM-dependent methyltransferase
MGIHTEYEISRLRQLATGYKASIALGVAVRLGVFKAIQDNPLSAADLADALRVNADALERLLNSLVALQLVQLESGEYRNSQVAASLLVNGGSEYQGGYIDYVYDIHRDWMNLEAKVRFGPGPRATYDAIVGQDPQKTKDFMAAMHTNALPNSRALLAAVDFSSCRRILDIGCGTGIYSSAIAASYPDVQCDLIDLPAVASIAEDQVRMSGVEDRVHVFPGNYLVDSLPHGYDVALLLAVIHQEDPTTIEALLRKIARALNSGGRLILSTFLLEGNKTAPMFSVLFSLEMLVVSATGRAYTLNEVSTLLKRCGFADVEELPGFSGPSTFIVARRGRPESVQD